jgi:hypothetical protein
LKTAAGFRTYLKEKVQVLIDGKDDRSGYIAAVHDEATGITDEVMTVGNLLTIQGYGLKIEAEESRKTQTGVFFKPSTGNPVKASIIAVNEPRTLKLIVPPELETGTAYTLNIITQSSVKGSGHQLKELREAVSDFTLTAQN